MKRRTVLLVAALSSVQLGCAGVGDGSGGATAPQVLNGSNDQPSANTVAAQGRVWSSARPGSVDFHDDFGQGLGNFAVNGESISLMDDCFGVQRCVKISRSNMRGYTFISRAFRVPGPGSLNIEVVLRADDVVPGAQMYHRGKVVAVLSENGKEVDWPNADFDGTISQWAPRTILVPDVDQSVSVDLRIGLQNATGTIYVDKVNVSFAPRP